MPKFRVGELVVLPNDTLASIIEVKSNNIDSKYLIRRVGGEINIWVHECQIKK